MFWLSDQTPVYLKPGITDGRLGGNGLRALVDQVIKQDVLSGSLFVFCNRRKNRICCLLWDGSGIWVAAKRLEAGTFAWPKDTAAVEQLNMAQLKLLLEGFELKSRRGWQRYEMPSSVSPG